MNDTPTSTDGLGYVLATLGHDSASFDVEAIVSDVHQAVGSWDFTRMDDENDDAYAVDYWAIVARHQTDQLAPNDQDQDGSSSAHAHQDGTAKILAVHDLGARSGA